MTIKIIPCLEDNYAYFFQTENGFTAIVDPGEAGPVLDYLNDNNLKLDAIFCTHHHGDHIGGNERLKQETGCRIIGPEAEKERISMDETLSEEDSPYDYGGVKIHVLETPGHTKGHICLHIPQLNALFSGDTLFSMGCGRLFEGSAEQMWNSLKKLKELPGETRIYCGHEYTLKNGEFCLEVEPDNKALQKRYKEAQNLRQSGKPTLPVSLSEELKTNAFLRAGSPELFAELRSLRDKF